MVGPATSSDVLAEELNFTQAARRLHLAQPALSRAIRQLEGYLKVTLFIRSTRKVELTDPGRKFVYEARKAVHYSERAMQIAVRQKRKDSPKLIVGYPSFCDLEFIADLSFTYDPLFRCRVSEIGQPFS